MDNTEITRISDRACRTVAKCGYRFIRMRLEGLKDLARCGGHLFLVRRAPTNYSIILQDSGYIGITGNSKDAYLKSHRCHYWLNSPDPDFEEKMLRIGYFYCNPPKWVRILCCFNPSLFGLGILTKRKTTRVSRLLQMLQSLLFRVRYSHKIRRSG